MLISLCRRGGNQRSGGGAEGGAGLSAEILHA